jgi:hypothetical protein
MQQATITPIHLQENLVTHGHGTGIKSEACNDETYQEENTRLSMLLSVLANMLGGTVLLSAMFVLPHLIGYLLS